MGIPDHLTCLLRNLYAGQEATVRTGHGTTDCFQIGKGVRQGCTLSPCLFNFYAEFSSVQLSCSVVPNSLRPHALQHTRPPRPSPSPGASSNSCPLSRWCHPTISSSAVPVSSLNLSQHQGLFKWVSSHIRWPKYCSFSSAPILPINIQDWSPLGWTGWISLPSKGLSSVFSNTTVQKHQFFSTQVSLWSNSHIYTWLLEKP